MVGLEFDDDKITYTLVMMYHQILKTDISRTGHLTVVIYSIANFSRERDFRASVGFKPMPSALGSRPI